MPDYLLKAAIVASLAAYANDGPHGWLKFVTWPEGITAWAIIFTLGAIVWQAVETRRTAQAALMSVEASKNATKKQLRAYIAVTAGSADPQDRIRGRKFKATLTLTNSGQTPAHNVRFTTKAAALPHPLPVDTVLPEPLEDEGGSTLGAGQSGNMIGEAESFQDDHKVQGTMFKTNGNAFYVWGIVHYDDAFGERHYTRFCFLVYWTPESIHIEYAAGRNEAT
jgi:hypothetical protein